MKLKLYLVFLWIFAVQFSLSAQSKAEITSFSPEGTVKNIKQVKVNFSSQMVPFGNPRVKTDQFEIDCPAQGKGRWIDEKTFVYEFPEPLEGGISCTFKLKPDVKSLAGAEITGKKNFSFTTGGPSVTQAKPYEGGYIEEEQIFIFQADSAINTGSVEEKLFFTIEGLKDKVGAKLVTGSEAEEILLAEFGKNYKADRIVLVKAKQKFANSTRVTVTWAKGILSANGTPNDMEQNFAYTVREPFNASFSCTRENEKANCMPLYSFSMSFTSQIPMKDAKKIYLEGGGKKWYAKIYNSENEPADATVSYISFEAPFPEETKFKINLPSGLEDDAGRKLKNAKKFPMEVKTDRYPPLAKFAGTFGIIESDAEPLLPVTFRNVEKEVKAKIIKMTPGGGGILGSLFGKKMKISPENILTWMKKVHTAKREASIFKGESNTNAFNVPKPNGDKAFEVVGIPLKEPGFYVVELESEKLGNSLLEKGGKMYVPTSALVTNMGVHFKWGREASIVWVTSLNEGKPVPGANVSVRDCKNNKLAEGATDSNGLFKLKGITRDKVNNCSYTSNYDSGLIVIAEKDNDLSFVHSSWENGIESWRFNLPGGYYDKQTIGHTILDRTLLRAGETVHMKSILRTHGMNGLKVPDSHPSKLRIVHTGSGQAYFVPVKWANGASEAEWKIPREAKLGSYEIYQVVTENFSVFSGEFQVQEFRVPLMKAIIQPPSEKLIMPKSFNVDVLLKYLSGGPASGFLVKVKTGLREKFSYSIPGYEEFTFGNGTVKEMSRKRGSNYSYDDGESTEEEAEGKKDVKQELTLDNAGTAKILVQNLDLAEKPQDLLTQLEFRDVSGEIRTISSRTPIYPAKVMVGLKEDGWATSKDSLKVISLVVDLNGRPKADQKVTVEMFQRKYLTSRKRLVGGFYSYEYFEEVKKIGTFCDGKTDAKGLYSCQKESPVSGDVILVARTSDSSGNEVSANKNFYVAGKDGWFEVSDHDRMDVLPEKKYYEPGETARFQVKVPFKTSTALVSIEREGVIETMIKTLSSSTPYIDIPIKGGYAPNVFVSVLAVRGRVGGIQPTAMIDLGRPSFKLGIGMVKVGWKRHELKVSVNSNRTVFKIRDKATIKVNVKTADGTSLPKNAEVALAAVDEGLIELQPNNSWDVLSAMMGIRSLEVDTSTAQMQVVGRRHYGLKALPPGGGGGNDPAREMFDTLLIWKGSVKLDANGDAEINVPLNDSLTGFKIVAVATAGDNYFGTGSTSIRSTQDLMLLSGIPPVSREGDSLAITFTLRNASDKAMETEVNGKADGIESPIETKSVSLEAGESKEIFWNVKIPFNREKLTYEFSARGGEGVSDRIKITQKIVPAIPVRVQQATLLQLENEYLMQVEKPENALEGRGGINVNYSRTLLENLGSVKDYMKKYPYTCLEQQVSKSIVLKDKESWNKTMNALPVYLDSDGFAKYFPSETTLYGSPVLTAYILAIANEAGLEIPSESKEKMLGALFGFVSGTVERNGSLPTADLTIRKLLALEALSRYGKAKVEQVNTLSFHAPLLPTSALLDWWGVLSRMKDIPKRNEKMTETENILRSRTNLQGTNMKFTSESSDFLWWLMVSPDQNATKLLLQLVNYKKWREDVPRIVRGTLARQIRGNWDLTTANAWGTLALEKFSKEYEKEAVAGESTATINSDSKTQDWNKSQKGGTSFFPWNSNAQELKMSHNGTGKPWVTVQSLAAVPLKNAVSNGYTIEKKISTVEKKSMFKWSRGDIYKVTLTIKSDSDMTWVVVNDPIPTGASILSGSSTGDAWTAFEERSFEGYRVYYEYAPQGEWKIEYTVRLNQDGVFEMPATRVEAMYSPDMYGETPNETIKIDR